MKTYREIEIKYHDGGVKTRCVVPVTAEALVHYELMTSHYIKLSFLTEEPIYFELGDYIETEYGRFELTSDVKPKEDGMAYSYEVQFDAYYRKWANKMLRYRPNHSSSEVSFVLTSNIVTHANIILDNLEYLAKQSKTFLYDYDYQGTGTDYVCSFDSTIDTTRSKVISYSSSSILDALANIAQTFECEWWVEGNIIRFGTCENNNAIVDFKINENISSMDDSKNQVSFANRVYSFGGEKNLPYSYKQDADADIAKYGVVQRRLMLPTFSEMSAENRKLLADSGLEMKQDGCIQVKGRYGEEQYVEGVYVNDDIYPKLFLKTQKVTSYDKDVEQSNNDGTTTYIKRTFYRLESPIIVNESGEKTGDLAFLNKYILAGQTLHVVFQSGSLNGMDFECAFNPDAEKEMDGGSINPKSQVFEVTANEDYGRFLPEGTMIPKVGDIFVLYNWDATQMTKNLVVAASNELLTDTIRNIKKSMVDPNTYTCVAEDTYTFNDGRGTIHEVGDRVNLYNKAYFDVYRQSRIIGYEIKLDIPYDGLKYYVGEKPAYSRLNSMESKIEEITYNGNSYASTGGTGNTIYIIKSYDETRPTDGNVYSAKAVDEQRLRRDKDDTAQGRITFSKGMTSDGDAQFNGQVDVREKGKFRQGLQLGDVFISGINGVGGKMDGGGNAEMRSLRLWETLEVPELRFNKVSVNIGYDWQAVGGGLIERVVPDNDQNTGTVYLKLEEGEFGAVAEGDLCMGLWHDVSGGNSEASSDDNRGNMTFAGFKTVYFQITSVSGENNGTATYILRSTAEGGNGVHPYANMTFACRGNISNKERQAFSYRSTLYQVSLVNVSTWEFQPANYYEIHGKLDGFSMPAYDSEGKEYVKQFSGYGQVFGNAYMFGSIDQFERVGVRAFIDQSLGGMMAPGDVQTITMTVVNGYGEDITKRFTAYSVVRNTGDTASDTVWNSKHQSVTNPWQLAFADLGINGITKLRAVFTMTATDGTVTAQSSIDYNA